MPDHTEQHVRERSEHIAPDHIALKLTERGAHGAILIPRHGKMVRPKMHEPLDEAHAHLERLVEACPQLLGGDGAGNRRMLLPGKAGLEVGWQRGVDDQRRIDITKLGDDRSPRRLGNAGRSAGFRAKAEPLECNPRRPCLCQTQRHRDPPCGCCRAATLPVAVR